MEIKTKQRIIGIAIIIVILLILIPLLFSSSKKATNEPAAESTLTTVEQVPVEATQSQPNQPGEPPLQSNDNQLPSTEQPSVGGEQPQINPDQKPSVTAPQDNYESPVPAQSPDQPLTNEQPYQLEETPSTPSNQAVIPSGDSDKTTPKITEPIKVTNGTPIGKKLLNSSASTVKSGNESDLETITRVKKWSVQLGIFSEKSNATQLLNKLKGDGFEAYLKELIGSGGRVYRVFVGRNYDHNKAQKVAHNLERNYHLRGVVVSN